MKIAKDKVVVIDYTLKDEKGEVMDSSAGREPLTYLHGCGNLIPGLESALVDKAAGDHVEVVVAPEDAYGTYNEQLIQTVSLDQFQEPAEIKKGVQIRVETDRGVNIATVASVEEKEVKLDMNHPLADKTLYFEVDVKSVRAASEEEIAHGHVHGEGGHQH
jgi:FKBP-type peptidyl-prolyl cis-trans isomerase SlyD